MMLVSGLRRHPHAAAIALIALIWSIAVFPNLAVRSFVWEEGTDAEVARAVLAHGDFLQPSIYGVRWILKPNLLSWIIAGVAAVTGQVDEWSARLPAMVSVLLTALLVWSVTRRVASARAAMFASLSFMFCPMLLQKLTIAEPDTLVTLLSFSAFVVWWNGQAPECFPSVRKRLAAGKPDSTEEPGACRNSDGSEPAPGRVTLARWIACGLILAVMALAKGPQPAGFFALGVGFHALLARRWRDLPGLAVTLALPAAAVAAWAAAVYRPGDAGEWRTYMRLIGVTDWQDYLVHNVRMAVQTGLELLPALLLLRFVPWPRQRAQPDVPPIVLPLLLYAGLCTAVLLVWPGANSRYAMPIAPAVAVLAGIGWDVLGKRRDVWMRRLAAGMLALCIVFQIVLVCVAMPMFADRFGASRIAGRAIDAAIAANPAPAYCTGLDTNQLFYVRAPLRCIDPSEIKELNLPLWLATPRPTLEQILSMRPDAKIGASVATGSGPELVAARLERK